MIISWHIGELIHVLPVLPSILVDVAGKSQSCQLSVVSDGFSRMPRFP